MRPESREIAANEARTLSMLSSMKMSADALDNLKFLDKRRDSVDLSELKVEDPYDSISHQ